MSTKAGQLQSSAYGAVQQFATAYGQFMLWVGVVPGVIALCVCSKNAKQKVVQAWQGEADKVRAQLQSDPDARESLRNDPEYHRRVERLDELETLVGAHATDLSSDQTAAATQETAQILDDLAADMSRSTIDLERALADNPTSAGTEQPKSKLQRLLAMLAGPRLSRDLALVGKYTSLLLVALLLTALTGWSATPLANSLRVTVNDLRVAALIDDVDREIGQAISQIDPPADDEPVEPAIREAQTAALARAARLVAQAAVHQIHNSRLLDPDPRLGAPASRLEFVRAAILHRPQDAGAPGSVVSSLRRHVAEGFAANRPTMSGDQLATHLTRDTSQLLARIQARNPRALDRIVDRVVRRYGTSVSPLNVQGNLISRWVSASFNLAGANVNDDLAKVAKTLAADAGKATLGEWANLHARAIATDGLLGADAKAQVIGRLEGGQWLERSPPNNALVRDLQLSRGTGWHSAPREAASESASRAIANAVAERYNPGSRTAIQRALGGYSAAFPRTAATVGHAANVSTFASDFAKAARSFRVRGVIVGRNVQPAFRVTDIAWQVEKDTREPTMLILRVVVDAREETLGLFSAGIVNQALRFAADGRVVATTITPGDGNAISRVTYLHPALEDTPLGCRIVEIDRIIDTFTASLAEEVGELTLLARPLKEISSHRVAAWRFLQVARLAEVAALSGPQCQPERLPLEASARPATKQAIAAYSSTVAELLDEQASSGHSTKLLETALQCSARESSDIGQCLCDTAPRLDLSQPYWFPEDHTSQVREQDVTGQNDFDTLFRPVEASDYIDLWLHTTFAVRQDGEPLGDEPETIALDFPRQQIKLLNALLIPDAIAAYAKTNLRATDYADLMAPIEQFVLVQRFMRTALTGGFGDAFPIEKLIELERETAPFVPAQPTIRWEPADEEQFFSVLSDAGDDASKAFFEWFDDLSRKHEQSSPSCDAPAH